jgi:phosphoglycerate dehydrogenase-like enzyme
MLALVKRLNEVTAIAKAAGDWGLPSRRTDEDTFAYNWSGRHGIGRIRDQTVGILGMGEIGAELARRLRGFAPRRLLYTKRARLPEQAETELGIVYATMDELVADSDMLCNLLPYAPNTDGLLGAGFFSQIKAGAILVSCGSGSVINEGALAAALRSGHLAGAALDTFEWEPLLPDNPLLPLARDPAVNLVLTPHVAAGGSTPPGADPPRRQDYENILRVLAGEPILYRVA